MKKTKIVATMSDFRCTEARGSMWSPGRSPSWTRSRSYRVQHFSAVLEVLQTDLGAFGVQQGGDRLAQLFTNGLQLFKAAQMLFVRAVGKIKTGNIHAVGDQLAQNAFLIGGRTQSADDLGFSHILLLPPTTTSHSLFCGRLSSYRQLRVANEKNPVLWYKSGKIL